MQALIVRKKEKPIAPYRTAESTPELIVYVFTLGPQGGGIVIVARVHSGKAQKLEGDAVKVIGAGFGDEIDHTAAVVTIFGIEVIGEDPELSNGVEVGESRDSI